jgi:hypothetical protein
MHAPSRGPARLVPLAAAAVTVLVAAAPAAAEPTRLPVYDVKTAGVGEAKAERLAAAFGLDTNLRHDDGSLAFLDVQRFGFLPVRALPAPAADEEGGKVVAEAPDLDAIRKIVPLGDAEARRRATSGLARAGLPFEGEGRVSHSHFDSVDAAGRQTLSADVDTHVSFPARLGDLPLVGPGAKSKLVFDPSGRLTYLRYARRELSQAATVPLLSTTAADALATARFTAGCPGDKPITGLKLSRRLVYYAPALSARSVQRIVPHYDYGAQASIGGRTVELEHVLLPAVAADAPKPTLRATAAGGRVTARTAVTGGRAPYTYRYGSCTTTLPDAAAGAGAETSYAVADRPGGGSGAAEQVTVTVTDADGLTATASARVTAGTLAAATRRTRVRARASSGGRVDVGSEGIGNSQGLPNTASNTADFRDEMEDVSTIAFHWADNDVFESDFVDAVFGGDDATWGDNVDLMWFQGHGNANGFATGATQGDGFVDKSEARWGDDDLEWLVVHSCDVLTLGSGSSSVWNRWKPAFRGLHLLLGYGNSSYNVDGDGNEFGDDLADDDMRIRSAWVDANESEQPDGVIYRYMGVYGPSGEWNRNDYFHGIGSVSGDITTVTGAWSYSGTV